jgi:protocatechuate 3,4-dioxygenase beta subunit
MKCQNCGRENEVSSQFCVSCGSTLTTPNSPNPDYAWKNSKEGKFVFQYFSAKKKDWVVKKLVGKFKMPTTDAEQLYEIVNTELKQYRQTLEFRRSMVNQGKRKMITGPIWAAAGLAITIYSITHPSSSGTFYIFWGAVIWGIYDFFAGLAQWLNYREKENRILTPREGSAAAVTTKKIPFGTKIAAGVGILGIAVIIVLLIMHPSRSQTTKFTPSSPQTPTPIVVCGSISGQIVDQNKKPISGAWVSASPFEASVGGGGATTDSSGNYQIKLLASGKYRVSAGSTGRVTQYWQNTANYTSAAAVSVTAPKDEGGINFTLETGGTISGTVTDTSGLPLAGITVVAYPSAGGTGHGMTTNQSGVFVINNLPLGSYKVSAFLDSRSGGGENYITKYYNNKLNSASADQVTLTANSPTANGINFTLEIGGVISGRVLDENGQPIARAYVWASLFGTDNSQGSGVYTDSSGNYHIKGLPSGNYRICANCTGKVTQYWQNAVYSSATPVSVTAPEDKTGINFTLKPSGIFSSP